jgi:8-oxo-dGTP pyrophosphatase MutT (NUDIX family)
MSERVERQAVRALLVDDDGAALLMKYREPASGQLLWLAPGGGRDPGESSQDCLRREVREETGLELADAGALVWTRRHEFRWNGRRVLQSEEFWLSRVARFDPSWDGLTVHERRILLEFRWWTPDAIELSSELFIPRALAPALRALLAEGPPPTPIDVGR